MCVENSKCCNWILHRSCRALRFFRSVWNFPCADADNCSPSWDKTFCLVSFLAKKHAGNSSKHLFFLHNKARQNVFASRWWTIISVSTKEKFQGAATSTDVISYSVHIKEIETSCLCTWGPGGFHVLGAAGCYQEGIPPSTSQRSCKHNELFSWPKS